jgi:hypothetical protein
MEEFKPIETEKAEAGEEAKSSECSSFSLTSSEL